MTECAHEEVCINVEIDDPEELDPLLTAQAIGEAAADEVLYIGGKGKSTKSTK